MSTTTKRKRVGMVKLDADTFNQLALLVSGIRQTFSCPALWPLSPEAQRAFMEQTYRTAEDIHGQPEWRKALKSPTRKKSAVRSSQEFA